MKYTKKMKSPVKAELLNISIRWFMENCCEIRLPNGKTIVLDPCLPKEGPWADMGFGSHYSVDDLEGCDYVIINHTHGDHVCSLGEVINRFDPQILVNADCAMALAKAYKIQNLYRIFPLQCGQTYDFGDFRLKTYPARHIDVYSLMKNRKLPVFSEEETALNDMGAVFNMNYLITTPNNYRIAFDAGLYVPSLNDWREAGPNLLMRHVDSFAMYGNEGAIINMANALERSGAQYMLINCVQFAYAEGSDWDLDDYIERINRLMEQRGCHARAFNFVMGQWYQIATGIQPSR